MSKPRYIVWLDDRQFWMADKFKAALELKAIHGGVIYEPLGEVLWEEVRRARQGGAAYEPMAKIVWEEICKDRLKDEESLSDTKGV